MPSPDSQLVPPADSHADYVQKCIDDRLAVLKARTDVIQRLTGGAEPKKRIWRGRKRDRVLAYLLGIAQHSKGIWTWANPRNIARALSKDPDQTVSAKTVWRVLRHLAENGHPKLRVRICQRQTKKNWHFQWLLSHVDKLAHDHEPLFFRADGKSRNLRLRCRKKNLSCTRTNASVNLYQQKRDSSPPGPLLGAAAPNLPPPPKSAPAPRSVLDNAWKRFVPTVEQLFHTLAIPTYKRGTAVWAHSPWKRDADKNPSCLIFPDEGRFWDFSTGQGGNAITLARLANPGRQMTFKEALVWLRSETPRLAEPAPWHSQARVKSTVEPFAQMLENLKIGGGKILPKPPRPEGLYRLAWRIYRTQFYGSGIDYFKPLAIVGLIAKALGRKAEKAAIEEAIQGAIERWKEYAPAFTRRCKLNSSRLRKQHWHHRDLRYAQDAEQFAECFSLGRFVNDLRCALDRSFYPAKSSPEVARNNDPKAVSMCLGQLREMFRDDEHVWITNDLRHRGWCRSAKYWSEDIAQNGVPTGPDGAWLKLNPMSRFGIGNDDVWEYRHILCEADSVSIDEQIKLLGQLPYPVVSAVHSGKKSIHIVLKIVATKESYPEIVKELHDRFPEFDRACKDPARWTRLAGACRDGVMQAAIPIRHLQSWSEQPNHFQC